jgi:hypothetical protein
MKVFDGELVWNVVHAEAGLGGFKRGEVWSCRVEACSDTKRLVGYELQTPASLAVADADYLYWLGGDDVQSGAPFEQLARTPRLK